MYKRQTLDGYRKIFADESIWTGFGNGLLYTIVGTLLNVVFTIPLAYALSRKEFPFGGVFMKIMVLSLIHIYLWHSQEC